MAKLRKCIIAEKVYRIRWAAGSEDHKTKKDAEARAALIALIIGTPSVESFITTKAYYTR